MTRWYAAYMSYNARTIIPAITNTILSHRLGEFVPLLRHEKGAPTGQFYLFLAIESEEVGVFPQEIANLLSLPGLGHYNGAMPIDEALQQLERFTVLGDYETTEYFSKIPIKVNPDSIQHPLNDEPQEISVDDSSCSVEQLESLEMTSNSIERLLHWASAAGGGSWPQLHNACLTLMVVNNQSETKQLLRRLRLLGHLESDNTVASSWSAAPPSLVKVGHQSLEGSYFFSGQRTESMISKLNGRTELHVTRQPAGDGPPRRLIRTNDLDSLRSDLETGIRELSYVYIGDVAKDIADKLLPIDQWINRLQTLPITADILPKYNSHMWSESGFHETVLVKDSGLYELWPIEDRMPKLTAYYDSVQKRWLRGDWYGLRFFSRVKNGDLYSEKYDPATGSLTIDETWRWPEIYERALVLSSGQLPRRSNRNLTYQWIDQETLATLHRKLQVVT